MLRLEVVCTQTIYEANVRECERTYPNLRACAQTSYRGNVRECKLTYPDLCVCVQTLYRGNVRTCEWTRPFASWGFIHVPKTWPLRVPPSASPFSLAFFSFFLPFTIVENGKKHRQNSHLINHCPTSEGVSEVSERASERVSAAEGASERVVRSKRTSERCERTSERTSEWLSTPICILGYSGPQCRVIFCT